MKAPRKRVYICARYKGNVKKNIKLAKEYSKYVFNKGFMPICVHFYLEDATGLHEKKGSREELLELGREFVMWCDEIWVFDRDGISEGMDHEIEFAKVLGKKIEKYKVNGEMNRCG